MKITICMGSRCVMTGAMSIFDQLEALRDSSPDFDLEIETSTCMKKCKEDENGCPYVLIDGELIKKATFQGNLKKIVDAYQESLNKDN
ncbi:(2Fe-2S) ferredoxin domain-containing protein [Peptoniphilus catoniae]|uniref:(2Fe-2S) ferredoxin domain-containing protein n=1 Tax=Peptoniphilus catoniae TaxID=1660341 RepID=UPI0010FCFBE3|nr:(2Fe-2S) ferredoxin domain-containing protein [Peptoniphilus catoniae]